MTTLESATTTSTTPALVPWSGPVEHLFFHSLIVHPDLAFAKDRLARGFRDYFVTVSEFRAILDQLYANGWTLVDIHRAVTGSVEVPRGRRPLVLSEDDVNYYDYSRHRGLGWRLVLDPAGDVKVELRDARGVRATDDDIVPILDAFVTAHPAFSASGAKGVLALTGYEGLLGERVNDQASPEWPTSVARAKALVARLRATGWTFRKPQLRPHRPDQDDGRPGPERHAPLDDRGDAHHRPNRHLCLPVRGGTTLGIGHSADAARARLHRALRHRRGASTGPRRWRDHHEPPPHRRHRLCPGGDGPGTSLRRLHRRGHRRSKDLRNEAVAEARQAPESSRA